MKGRFIRLGIPLVAGFFMLIPFSLPEINFGHLWFLQHLLIYSTIYAVIRTYLLNPSQRNETVHKPFPSFFVILLFTIFVALITFVVRIWYPIDHWIGFLGVIQTEFAHVPQYVCFFTVGIISAKNNWLVQIPKRIGAACLTIGIVFATIVFSGQITSFRPGGLNVGSLQYSLVETFLCMGMCIGLIFLFHRLFNKTIAFMRLLSSNAFTVYIIHVPVVVIFQYLVEGIRVSAYVRFGLVIVLGIVMSFLISHFLIRKIPYVNKIL